MDLDEAMAGHAGLLSRRCGVQALGRHAFDNAVRSGRLAPVFPRVYAYPWDADLPEIRRRAALLSVGGDSALSHLTALEVRDLPVPEDSDLHVTAYLPRHPRGVPGELRVHRSRRPLDPVDVGGVPVMRLENALTSSWALLSGPAQRAPLIEATRRRLVSVTRLLHEVEVSWWIKDVRSLRALVGLVAAGCESELELWGYTSVFDVPGLNDAHRQRVVHVGGRSYRLDMAYDEDMLAVELDGRAFHASPAQWERDIARDLALATVGWQTVRLSHRRLVGDVEGCRRDVLDVRAARRRRTG